MTGTGVRVLTSAELHAAIPVADVVDMVERSYTAAPVEVPRAQLRRAGAHTFVNVLPALEPDFGWLCVYAYTGGNRGLGVPQKVALLFSTADGGLKAVIESDWLSWARTGASGAVATRHLARPGPVTLGVFGSGKQAHAQVVAIAAERELDAVVVYSRDPERRAAFAERIARDLGVAATAAGRPEDVLEAADVVSTATNSREPVFDGARLRPGTHVNAIGQHYPDRRELDDHAVARSAVFADDRDRALGEDGELLIPIGAGVITRAHVLATLGDVVTGRHPGRTSDDQITLFCSGGTSAEYLAVAAGVAERALAQDLGTTIRLDTGWG